MTLSPSPPSKPAPSWKATLSATVRDISNVPSHPVQIALRTYSLCLSLCLGPALLPLIFALTTNRKSLGARPGAFWHALERELHPTGFAFAITTAVAGSATLQRCWNLLRRYPWVRYINSKSSPWQRAFLANTATSTLAVTLLRRKRHSRRGAIPPTLDLTLLFFVRALDAWIQAFLLRKTRDIAVQDVRALSDDGITPGSSRPLTSSGPCLLGGRRDELAKKWQRRIATHLDALVFWASSARIMWCFFYQPQRLPLSYVKWINSLANVNRGLLEVLRALRKGTWSYIHGSSPQNNPLGYLAKELGRPLSWADPTRLPAHGGDVANEAWKRLGVNGRYGIGGLPCELVHGGVGAGFGLHNSCAANAVIRAIYAFAEAFSIYLPVHFLPILLTRPKSITRPRHALPALLSAIRSATFLSTFISSYWFAVCFTRTLVLARLLPTISHDVWDGPYGCILSGSLVCGASIWIENAKRRGEMALYVLPKALRASISETWLRGRHPMIRFAEPMVFVLSLASLLTFSVHQPESLRGLARWTLTFVTKGPNAGFWERRGREVTTCPPTPVVPTIYPDADNHED